MTQFAYGLVPFIDVPKAEAAAVCVPDTAGANDEPGQKDLTRLCEESAPAAGTEVVSWNWDDLGTSGGGQSLDACGLFDSDGDTFINYSICVTTQDDPAVIDTVSIYTCTADSKIDRCAGPSKITTTYATTCTVTQQGTDPFPAGDFSPQDTVASCNFVLADLPVAVSSLVLTDVCSYPSREPNSDPSDCVIIQTNPVALIEVVKDLIPANNAGLFNLSVDGPGTNDTTTVNNVGDGGTTGIVSLSPSNNGGIATVSETAGTNTSLANYSSSISCVNRSSGTVVIAGAGTSIQVPVSDGSNIICTITNTAASSITIVKDAIPNSAQDFGFTATGTGTSPFTLDDDADQTLPNSMTFNNLAAGTYTFTEAQVAGWYLDQIDCPNITESGDVANRTVSLTVAAGQNITCTFTNKQFGQIIVSKQTNPDNDPTLFGITASPSAGVVGNASQTIADGGTVTYTVKHDTYSVAETVPSGWTMTSNNCSNLVIDGNTPIVGGIPTLSCQIVNTKLAKLKIIKDALPNGPQDFAFTTSNNLTGFILDDDAVDTTYSSQQQFVDLTPNQAYSVTEGAVTGWDLTSALCSKAMNLVGTTVTVSLLPGEDVTCTFTNTQRGSISGVKFNDVNGNGVYDQGEPVLSGWNIFIDANNNGILDQGEVNMLTDNDGLYTFSNLVPDNYTLAEVLLNGWTQTLAPATVTLDPGEVSTGNNFGNFQHGSVSGVKFNDHDGQGDRDQGDEGLAGWTINIFNDNNDQDSLLNNLVATTQTDGTGAYSFSNLPKGTYQICEVQQNGWTQTFPANQSCHLVTIDVSGEVNPNLNFGNQGRGGITVVKNVDTDGDGDIDSQNVTNWNWNIDGQGNFTTGSGNAQNVAAGSYTVSEVQKANFHVTASSCSGETTPQNPTEQLGVTVSAGESVTCTFVNTRDTGTITVRKLVNPTSDTGLFDLNINGTTYGNDVGHGQGTGTIQLPTGTYNVSETDGANTSLNNYSSSYDCNNQVGGQGTASGNFTLSTGQDIVCTFTNTRLGTIIVQKETNPDGDPATFNFTASYDNDGFSLSDGQSNNSGSLLPGTYSVAETVPAGWDLESATCSDQSSPANIQLGAGETITCTFTNEKDANIIVQKETNPDGDPATFNFTASYDNDGFTLGDGDSNDSGDLDPGVYTVAETVPVGWDLESATCSDGSSPATVNLAAGETVTCTFTNEKDANIVVVKQTDPDGSTEEFNFTASYDQNGFTLSDGQSNDSGDLDPGTYSVGEIVPLEWDLTSTVCSDGSASNAIDLSAGETVTCTFNNRQDGHIIVQKETNPDGDPATFNFTASYDNDGFTLGDGQSNDSGNLDPGIYSVAETVPEGWDLENVTCSDGSLPLAVDLSAGETVTCTFTNEKDANIVVVKETLPDGDPAVFSFDASYNEAGFTLSDGQSNDSGDLDPGTYSVDEIVPAGWDLDTAVCSDQSDVSAIDLTAGETVTCTFTNVKRANVIVTKYNDRNQDGTRNDGEEALAGWDITLAENAEAGFTASQATGADGTTTFADIVRGDYALSEDLESQAGWNFSDIDCTGVEGGLDGQTFFMAIAPGAEVNCEIGNFPDAALNITKANNRPAPTVVGDTVTYTLTVSVPDDAGAVFDTTVQDLPPENFDYLPGSWTATSSVRGDIKADGITTEPTYGSPGAWKLGDMLPGEVVTLTYRALIANSVISGSYPDIAFTQGCDAVDDCEVVLGNVSTGANSPFVRTAVAVTTPQVLGANTTVLVETGQRLQQAAITTISLILLGLSMLVVFRRKEGGRS